MALNGIDRFGDRFGGTEISKTPSGHSIRLAEAVHRDGEIVIFLAQARDAVMSGSS